MHDKLVTEVAKTQEMIKKQEERYEQLANWAVESKKQLTNGSKVVNRRKAEIELVQIFTESKLLNYKSVEVRIA